MKMTMWDACGPGGTAGTAGPEGVLGLSVTSALLADLSCQVETPLRVFLYSCGTSYLRSQAVLQCTVCKWVPVAPPISRVQLADACSCNHRARTAGGCRMQLDGYDVGRMHSWWQGHRVGCGGAGDSAGRRPEPGGGPLAE